MTNFEIYLASASPRRKSILETIGICPHIIGSNIDETPYDGEEPDSYVMRLAKEKAMSSSYDIFNKEQALVIAGDTIVVHDGHILQKPKDEEDAFEMLKKLSGTEHHVYSGICIYRCDINDSYVGFSKTTVYMDSYTDKVIESYIKTGEPMDKAGAYGIQGIGSILVKSIEGDYNNVVGLPISTLIKGFDHLNISFFSLLNHDEISGK